MADSAPQAVNNTLHSPIFQSQDVDKTENKPNLSSEIARNGETNIEKPNTDPNTIGWDGNDDPENPKNWPESKKWGMVVILAFITFLTSVIVFPNRSEN